MTALLGEIVNIHRRIDLNELLLAPGLTNPSILMDADGQEIHLVLKKNRYDRRLIWNGGDRSWHAILESDGKMRVDHVYARLTAELAVIGSRPLQVPTLRMDEATFDTADDVRLIEWNARLWLLGSCLKSKSVRRGGAWNVASMTTRMFLSPLNSSPGATSCVFPAFFSNARFDKNWIPHERTTGELLLSVDFNRNLWIMLDRCPTPPVQMPRHDLEWQGGWSGSSSLVEIDQGYIAILHRTVQQGPPVYNHMLVICDRHFRVRRRSEPFTFEGEPVEFCVGLTRNQASRQLLASYGVWDEQARIVTFSEEDAVASCSHAVNDPRELYAVT